MPESITTFAIWFLLIVGGLCSISVVFLSAIALRVWLLYRQRDAENIRIARFVRTELSQMDRWCAENPAVVLCCQRLRRLLDNAENTEEPNRRKSPHGYLEGIADWREKVRVNALLDTGAKTNE